MLAVAFGVNAAGPEPLPTHPGTARMVERLRQLTGRANPLENGFLSLERARFLGRELRGTTNYQQLAELGPMFAAELLQSGQSEAAMKQFRLLGSFYTQFTEFGGPTMVERMHLGQAISALRLGEQENCILNHTAESCLFPLQPGGFHQLPRGSRTAIPLLTGLLEQSPDDLRARWLLNIAHMTLGEWPRQVPAKWRLGPEIFASEVQFPVFPEVAGRLGLDVDELGGGTVADDFDNDGFLDLMVSTWSLSGQVRLFRNTGDGRFVERTAEAALTGLTGGLNMVSTDYNNDGFTDVLVLRGAWLGQAGRHPNSLLRNNGDGTFADVTEEAGLLSFHPTQAAAWFDFDNDGWLDLFLGNETQNPNPQEAHPCELHRNNGDGTFTECARASGVDLLGWVKAVTAGDYDGDGRPDLYLSLRDGANYLIRNEGPLPGHSPEKPAWNFNDVTDKAGVAQPLFSFPTWFFDYDQDGRLDLFVAGYYIRHVGDIVADYLHQPHQGTAAKLYRNRGDGTFEDVSKAAGLDRVLHAMGSNFGDLDNDGFPDFYLGTGDPDMLTLVPNVMLWNDGGRRFRDVTTAGRFGHLQKGHGAAFADFDNDGDQDVYMNMGGAYSGDNYRNVLFQNPGSTNRWLTLKLEGVKASRAALGARIKVNVATAAGPRAIYRWIGPGGSFGVNPLRAEIGLGAARSVESVEILWPGTAEAQVLRGIEPNRAYRIREGTGQPIPWNLKPAPLDLTRPNHHAAPDHDG